MEADSGQPGAAPGARAWTLTVAVAVLVVAFCAGSASVHAIKSVGLHLRWAALVGVLVLAAALALAQRRRAGEGLARFAALAGGFIGLAVVSIGWSVAPRLTFERAGSLGLLFLTAALLAHLGDGDRALRRAVLAGAGAGAIAAAVLGVLLLVVDYDAAAQTATAVTPWRYRGFMENPNTISVLAAVALPLIGWLGLTASGRDARVAWWSGGALLFVSVVGAESRGGLIAATAGVAVLCAVVVRPWRKLAVTLVVLAVALAGGIELRVVTDPGPQAFVSQIPEVPVVRPQPGGSGGGGGGGGGGVAPGSGRGGGGGGGRVGGATSAIPKVRITTHELPGEDLEIGHPLLSRRAASLAGSGRVAEWKGVLEQVTQRPLLGYGFGTEERVFRDRWYYFQGGTAENSYLGLLLQLGVTGTLALLSLGLVLVVLSVRTIRCASQARRGEVAAELGVLVAAGALMLIQSYVYSVGNVASGTVWLSLFLLGANVLGRDRADG